MKTISIRSVLWVIFLAGCVIFLIQFRFKIDQRVLFIIGELLTCCVGLANWLTGRPIRLSLAAALAFGSMWIGVQALTLAETLCNTKGGFFFNFGSLFLFFLTAIFWSLACIIMLNIASTGGA